MPSNIRKAEKNLFVARPLRPYPLLVARVKGCSLFLKEMCFFCRFCLEIFTASIILIDFFYYFQHLIPIKLNTFSVQLKKFRILLSISLEYSQLYCAYLGFGCSILFLFLLLLCWTNNSATPAYVLFFHLISITKEKYLSLRQYDYIQFCMVFLFEYSISTKSCQFSQLLSSYKCKHSEHRKIRDLRQILYVFLGLAQPHIHVLTFPVTFKYMRIRSYIDRIQVRPSIKTGSDLPPNFVF